MNGRLLGSEALEDPIGAWADETAISFILEAAISRAPAYYKYE